jgi:hypothetical protein
VEAKRFDCDFKTSSVREQHFKQLRFTCIDKKLSYVYGVITNLETWFFTKYDLASEIQGVWEYKNQAAFEIS